MPSKEVAAVPPATPGSRFPEAVIETSLIALALESGNARNAVDRLKRFGGMEKVPDRSTLQRWQSKHNEKYESLQRTILPKLRTEQAERHSALADQEMELAADLIQLLHEKKEKLDPRDLSTALRNTDVGSGIHTQRAQELRGDPPPPQVHLDMTDLIRSFVEKGTKLYDNENRPLTQEEAIAKYQTIPVVEASESPSEEREG